MSLEPKKCAKCPTPIIWATAKTTGKAMPVDAAPATNGNIRLSEQSGKWYVDVLSAQNAETARLKGESLHLNHFVTCPAAESFRKKREGARG